MTYTVLTLSWTHSEYAQYIPWFDMFISLDFITVSLKVSSRNKISFGHLSCMEKLHGVTVGPDCISSIGRRDSTQKDLG